MLRHPRVLATVAAVVLVLAMTMTTEPPWLHGVLADLLAPAVPGKVVERALNVVLFVPLGVVIAVWGRPWWLLAAAAGSVAVELVQFLLPRSPELSDVITNTLGAVLGYAAATWWRRRRHQRRRRTDGEAAREVDWSSQ